MKDFLTVLIIACVVVVSVYLICSCYKGDPGHGNIDYPEKVNDAGKD